MQLQMPIDSFFMVERLIAIVIFLTLKDHESTLHHVEVILSFLCLCRRFSWILID
jgi:hypothetical protein